jgi:Mg2+ and Co2+ transporter CorA
LFEDFCVSNWSACCQSCNIKCKVCCAKCNGKEFDELDFETAGFVLSDDVLLEVHFNKLYKMYVQALKDIQKYKTQLAKNIYTNEDHKYYVRKYLETLDRNVAEMREIIGDKYEVHEDMIHQANNDLDFELLSME